MVTKSHFIGNINRYKNDMSDMIESIGHIFQVYIGIIFFITIVIISDQN